MASVEGGTLPALMRIKFTHRRLPIMPPSSVLSRLDVEALYEVHMQAAKLLAALALVAGSAAAGAQEVGDARKGLAFAQKVCAECHAVAPRELTPLGGGPPFRAIANTPGMTAMALTVFFRTSHRTMPNLIVADDDRDNVIAYILSLRDKR